MSGYSSNESTGYDSNDDNNNNSNNNSNNNFDDPLAVIGVLNDSTYVDNIDDELVKISKRIVIRTNNNNNNKNNNTNNLDDTTDCTEAKDDIRNEHRHNSYSINDYCDYTSNNTIMNFEESSSNDSHRYKYGNNIINNNNMNRLGVSVENEEAYAVVRNERQPSLIDLDDTDEHEDDAQDPNQIGNDSKEGNDGKEDTLGNNSYSANDYHHHSMSNTNDILKRDDSSSHDTHHKNNILDEQYENETVTSGRNERQPSIIDLDDTGEHEDDDIQNQVDDIQNQPLLVNDDSHLTEEFTHLGTQSKSTENRIDGKDDTLVENRHMDDNNKYNKFLNDEDSNSLYDHRYQYNNRHNILSEHIENETFAIPRNDRQFLNDEKSNNLYEHRCQYNDRHNSLSEHIENETLTIPRNDRQPSIIDFDDTDEHEDDDQSHPIENNDIQCKEFTPEENASPKVFPDIVGSTDMLVQDQHQGIMADKNQLNNDKFYGTISKKELQPNETDFGDTNEYDDDIRHQQYRVKNNDDLTIMNKECDERTTSHQTGGDDTGVDDGEEDNLLELDSYRKVIAHQNLDYHRDDLSERADDHSNDDDDDKKRNKFSHEDESYTTPTTSVNKNIGTDNSTDSRPNDIANIYEDYDDYDDHNDYAIGDDNQNTDDNSSYTRQQPIADNSEEYGSLVFVGRKVEQDEGIVADYTSGDVSSGNEEHNDDEVDASNNHVRSEFKVMSRNNVKKPWSDDNLVPSHTNDNDEVLKDGLFDECSISNSTDEFNDFYDEQIFNRNEAHQANSNDLNQNQKDEQSTPRSGRRYMNTDYGNQKTASCDSDEVSNNIERVDKSLKNVASVSKQYQYEGEGSHSSLSLADVYETAIPPSRQAMSSKNLMNRDVDLIDNQETPTPKDKLKENEGEGEEDGDDFNGGSSIYQLDASQILNFYNCDNDQTSCTFNDSQSFKNEDDLGSVNDSTLDGMNRSWRANHSSAKLTIQQQQHDKSLVDYDATKEVPGIRANRQTKQDAKIKTQECKGGELPRWKFKQNELAERIRKESTHHEEDDDALNEEGESPRNKSTSASPTRQDSVADKVKFVSEDLSIQSNSNSNNNEGDNDNDNNQQSTIPLWKLRQLEVVAKLRGNNDSDDDDEGSWRSREFGAPQTLTQAITRSATSMTEYSNDIKEHRTTNTTFRSNRSTFTSTISTDSSQDDTWTYEGRSTNRVKKSFSRDSQMTDDTNESVEQNVDNTGHQGTDTFRRRNRGKYRQQEPESWKQNLNSSNDTYGDDDEDDPLAAVLALDTNMY